MGQRSSKDVPASLASKTISADIALGAGCYWGTEKFIMKGKVQSSRFLTKET